MVVSSSSQLVIDTLGYTEETTEGTTPTASPTFTAIGPVSSFSIKKDNQFIDVSQIGPEDLITLVQGPNQYEFSIKYAPTNSTFLQYGINAANSATPTGTISKSVSIALSFYLNGTKNYILLKGCRCKSATLSAEVGKPLEVSMEFVTLSITVPFSTANAGLTTPTFATTPTGAVWDWISGTTSPVTWNSSAINCKKFSITVARNTKVDYVLGNLTGFSSQPHGRRISGDLTNILTDTTIETDYAAGTARTLAFILKDSVSTLTVTSAKVTTYSVDRDSDSDEATVELCGFRALSCTVT